VGAIVFVFSRREPELNIANWNRVRVGMKRQQVEHILGGPPGDYATRPGHTTLRPADPTAIADTWITDNGAVVIYYDASGKVTGMGAIGCQRISDTRGLDGWIDRISTWFY
jgi:hypothetical protein